MCFFGKQRYVAAVSCLKRALYLGECSARWRSCMHTSLCIPGAANQHRCPLHALLSCSGTTPLGCSRLLSLHVQMGCEYHALTSTHPCTCMQAPLSGSSATTWDWCTWQQGRMPVPSTFSAPP